MDRRRIAALWARGQRGWPPGSPVAQFPNPPLIAAFVALAVGALTEGAVHAVARAVFYLGLGVWAYLELAQGVNAFRRVIGAVGLAYVIVRLAQAFGA